MATYEYKILSSVPRVTAAGQPVDWSEVEGRLNALAADGWEVFASHSASYGKEVLGVGTEEPVLTFVLRRSRS